MKFPRLPRFFHKRSQSDSALYRRAQPAGLPPRPVSASFSHASTAPTTTTAGSLSDFLSLVPTEPLAVAVSSGSSGGGGPMMPRPVSSTTTVASSATCSTGQISAASQPIVIDVLTRRIQELQDELVRTAQEKQQQQHPLDQDDGAVRDLEAQNQRLQDELCGLRRTLGDTETERDALHTENTHLRTLLDLPVLSGILERVASGADAEDAVVHAIQTALRQPGSAWRQILEPVTGPRSPEDYIAQVNCTLRARREGRRWMQRAAFWKGHVKDGAVVTPSASQLSDVLEAAATGARAEEVRVQVQVCREVMTVDDASELPLEEEATPLSPVPVPRSPDAPSITSTPADTEGTTGSMEAPSPSAYAHLPPLASVTFRESHSIRSQMSLPPKKEVAALLVHSASMVSQGSHKSRRTTPTKVTQATPAKPTNDRDAADPPRTDLLDASGPSPTRKDASRSTSTSASDLSSTSWDFLSSIIDRSLSFTTSPPKTTSDHNNTVAATILPGPSIKTQPIKPSTLLNPINSSPGSSPTKKSRLPVLSFKPRTTAGTTTATARLMRRLSKTISKPVLVDSTNAAAVGDSVPGLRAGRVKGGQGVQNVIVKKEKENPVRRRPVGAGTSPVKKR